LTDPLVATVRDWLRRATIDLTEAAVELTELDARIGDGDHGINLRRGMEAVALVLDEAGEEVGSAELLRLAGRRIISVVGGASGPLYGTLLTATADALADDSASTAALAAALQHGVAAVGRRGRSEAGQKTMLDALLPAVDALTSSLAASSSPVAAGAAAARAARAGRDATRQMVAQRGRASYLGARSIGHVDPGAASSAILVAALASAMTDQPAAPASVGASR
jgi:dihydroxyacetone kinase-like protein